MFEWKKNRFKKTVIMCSSLVLGAILGTSTSSAQAIINGSYYYNVVVIAPPQNWGPGEIRSDLNYGAIAWYQKAPGQYGYVFNSGNLRDFSASLNVDIECTRRRITCEGKRVVLNEWLVVGSYNSRPYFATATGPTRAAAEALVQEQCRKDGTTCTIKDAFEVMPHRRGAAFQRQKMVVR
jgi:Domain of unknown function (DUF4189)